jgi:hypothetical protein
MEKTMTRSHLVTALQKNRMRWIVSNYELSNRKTQRKIPEFCPRNKGRTILQELKFDQELHEVLLNHHSKQVSTFEHYHRELWDFKKMSAGWLRADKYISQLKGQHILSEKNGAKAAKGVANKQKGFHKTFSKVTAPAYRIHRLVIDEWTLAAADFLFVAVAIDEIVFLPPAASNREEAGEHLEHLELIQPHSAIEVLDRSLITHCCSSGLLRASSSAKPNRPQ